MWIYIFAGKKFRKMVNIKNTRKVISAFKFCSSKKHFLNYWYDIDTLMSWYFCPKLCYSLAGTQIHKAISPSHPNSVSWSFFAPRLIYVFNVSIIFYVTSVSIYGFLILIAIQLLHNYDSRTIHSVILYYEQKCIKAMLFLLNSYKSEKAIFHLYLPQESNKTEKGDRFSPQAGE